MTSKRMKMEDDLNFKAVLSSWFNNKNLKNKWFWHHRDWPSSHYSCLSSYPKLCYSRPVIHIIPAYHIIPNCVILPLLFTLFLPIILSQAASWMQSASWQTLNNWQTNFTQSNYSTLEWVVSYKEMLAKLCIQTCLNLI